MANKENLPVKGKSEKKRFVWTKKKIIAASIIGAAVLSAIVFIIIVLVNNLGPVRPIKSSEEEARVVGEVGGYEVRYEELRYITLLHKASLDKTLGEYDTLDEDSKAEYSKQLEEKVMSDIKSNYVVLALCDKYGIKTDTPYVNNRVQKKIAALVDASKEDSGFDGDKDAYKAWLKDNGLTDSFLRFIYKIDYLETELFDYFKENKIDIKYTADNKAEFSEYVMESDEWIRTVHVYYPKTHPFKYASNVPSEIRNLPKWEEYVAEVIEKYDPDKEIEEAFSAINDISDDQKREKKMRSLIGMTPVTEFAVSGNGFYFTYGQMSKNYEKIAFELEMYEVSEVFEYEGGYCFMMRLPLLESDVKKHSDELLSQYQYLVLKNHMDAKEGELSFVGNDYFNGINLADIE